MNDLIAASRQALEALERIKHHFDTDEYAWEIADEAITTLRTAIKAAEKQQALDKKAENARELGLSYDQNQE